MITTLITTPVLASSGEDVSIELSEIEIEFNNPEQLEGTDATISGTVTIIAEAQARGLFAYTETLAEAGYAVTNPENEIARQNSFLESDSDWGFISANSDTQLTYNWQATFNLNRIGDWSVSQWGYGEAYWQTGLWFFEKSGYEDLWEEVSTEFTVYWDYRNYFQVMTRFAPGDKTRYQSEANITASDVEAEGWYGDHYLITLPADTIITQPSGERVHKIFVDSIVGDAVTVKSSLDVEFSQPCTVYIDKGGELYQDRFTEEWVGDGEWVEVGSFSSIVDGEASLK